MVMNRKFNVGDTVIYVGCIMEFKGKTMYITDIINDKYCKTQSCNTLYIHNSNLRILKTIPKYLKQ